MSVIYITSRFRSPTHQISVEELLFGPLDPKPFLQHDATSTHTYRYNSIGEAVANRINVPYLINILSAYNRKYADLRAVDRASLYRSFHIPKKSGGLRRIDAPNEELMIALRELKYILEEKFRLLYHTTAFAYIHGRSTISAVKKHQQNQSRWYAKFDLHGFFPSTTLEFVMEMFSMIFPLSEIMKDPEGRKELETALSLCFLNGGLPQGTPISPTITNVMMIPLDYTLTKRLRSVEGQSFVNTRYADDFIISSRTDFSVRKIENMIKEVLAEFHAPFTINEKKTRYGSNAGRNWNLGVMVNKDNEITIGNKKKKQFQNCLYNYVEDKKKGVAWSREDIMTFLGLYSYYHMVEPLAMERVVCHAKEKLGVDVLSEMRAEIS